MVLETGTEFLQELQHVVCTGAKAIFPRFISLFVASASIRRKRESDAILMMISSERPF